MNTLAPEDLVLALKRTTGGITYATTLAAAQALIAGMQSARSGELDVAPLQEL